MKIFKSQKSSRGSHANFENGGVNQQKQLNKSLNVLYVTI